MLSNVSFGTRMGVFDRANVDAPQTYARPIAQPVAPQPKKSGSVVKTVAKLVATAAVIAGALAAGTHYKAFDAAKIGKMMGSMKDAAWLSAAKEPAKKALAGLDKAGQFVIDKSKSIYGVVSEHVAKGVEWAKNLVNKAA